MSTNFQPIASCPHDIPVLFYKKEWEDADFNPTGVREGFYNPNNLPEDYTSAIWDGCQDCYHNSYEKPTHWIHIPVYKEKPSG